MYEIQMIHKTQHDITALPSRDKVSASVWNSCSSQHSHPGKLLCVPPNAQHTGSSNSITRCTSTRKAYICRQKDTLGDSVKYKSNSQKQVSAVTRQWSPPGLWGLHARGAPGMPGCSVSKSWEPISWVCPLGETQNSLRIDGCSVLDA